MNDLDCRMMRRNDLEDKHYKAVNANMARIYQQCRREPEHGGEFGPISWSRGWEYPYVACAVAAQRPYFRTPLRPLVERLVDLGCGASPLPIYFADSGAKVIGVDNDAEHDNGLWGYWPQLAQEVSTGVTPPLYVNADMMDTDLADDFADVTVCVSVIEHLYKRGCDDPKAVTQAAFAEMVRITIPGGLIVVTADWRGDPQPSWPFRPEWLLDYATETGAPVKLAGHVGWTHEDLVTVTPDWWQGCLTVLGFVFEKET